ncbi:hypothetical protein Y032_0193g1404 [Ancylostoma ceylanicum]|uniref:Uncharacterized protein n=1 Tax=Ancylostoma ceylanicum TaxID=53326 RepID=A0A016SQC2_9BILA|nr:hypothetical protein Y032_0193g1404 [Ancylostoma ceylanicum]
MAAVWLCPGYKAVNFGSRQLSKDITFSITVGYGAITTAPECLGRICRLHGEKHEEQYLCLTIFNGFLLQQKVFIGEISKSVFQATPNASAGLWVYGFTNFDRDPAKTIDRMRVNYEAFLDDLNKNMEIHDHLNKRPLDSKTAAREINKVDYKGKANCITFFAGVRSAGDMGHLNPEKLDEPKRVVLVSLRGVNLTTKVDEPKGAAVIVSKNYTTDDVSRVVNSILSVFK